MGKGEGHGVGAGLSRGKTERVAVPAMPMPLAILCCIFNFLVPGLGTILAGFSVFCCARNEDMTSCKRVGSCCISFGIGLLQLLTTLLLLIGWIWSCIWGVFFLGMSSEYYHDNPPDADRGRIITQQPQPTVVVQQGPYPQGQGYHQPQWQGQQPWQNQGQQWPQGQGQPQSGIHPNQYGHHGGGPNQAPPYAGPYGGELPPPYSETPSGPAPSAPPAEKM